MKALRNSIIIFTIISLLFSATVYAQKAQLPKHCLDSSIKSVQAKVSSHSKKTFTYYYQKITKHADLSKPTFIIIPGGPGRSAMTFTEAMIDQTTGEPVTSTELYWGLPLKSNVILTGPRSVDCNVNNKLPVSSYSTKNIVQDLIALIQKEKLTNYIIVARSYGTVVATQLSYYIENNKKIVNPRAVLLTGVLGHYLDVNTRGSDLQFVWAQLYKTLDNSVQKMFPADLTAITDSEDFKFPLGIEAQTWINMIQAKLKIGFDYFTYKVVLQNFLINLGQTLSRLKNTSKGSPMHRKVQQHLNQLKYRVKAYASVANNLSSTASQNSNSAEKKMSLFEVIIQKEIYVGLGENPVSKSKLWNSNNYQIKNIPIIYFQGSWDISTPISNGLHHYKGQKIKKHKYFIIAKKGGHDILTGLDSCKTNFWQALSVNNFKSMTSVIQNCDPNFKVLK